MKILFYGTPAFAVPSLQHLIDSEHEVTAVVTQTDKPHGRGKIIGSPAVKKLALEKSIPVIQPTTLKDDSVQRSILDYGADIGVVVAYGKFLPDPLLTIPRHGTINVHASLLPKYRGAAPIQRAIMAGESVTGVTIIRLVNEMDAGPMLAHSSLKIGRNDTSSKTECALANLGAKLLHDTLAVIEQNQETEIEQNHNSASFAPRLCYSDGLIDWNNPARDIHNQIRALHDWPNAYAFLKGIRYIIFQSQILPATRTGISGTFRPGEIIEAREDSLVVSAGENSALCVTEIQREGKRKLPLRAFLAGCRWTAGLAFSKDKL